MFLTVILIVLGVLLGVFLMLEIIALIKKPNSVYKNEIEQKNPVEGKKVIFVEDERCEINADGVRGYLEVVGDSEIRRGFYANFVKRFLDVFISFFGLLLLSPVFLVIVIAIKIDDPGPIFFIQKRIGKNKRYFKLHKFRSMKMSTPHDVPTHMLDNPAKYITKVGAFLRAHSLDELPQIWDIFIGNMSIIGPRPALWNQDLLTAQRDKYGANDITPGLTGLAQINGRDELSLFKKAELDGKYAENISFKIDFGCFFGTVGKVYSDDTIVEGADNTNSNISNGTIKEDASMSELNMPEKRHITDVTTSKTANNISDIPKFENTVWLSSPTMHGDELKYITEAYNTNWMSTIGENINESEKMVTELIGCEYAVGLNCGTSALHLAFRLAGVKPGDKVFCSDLTFDATVNPVLYEGGTQVFIDSEYETWNMDPTALEKAFEIYPDTKVVVCANLYGTPAKLDEIRAICDKHNAILIEDAAESLGAKYKGRQTGTFGTFNAISFNGNKIITGSSGGMLLTDSAEAANKARKWSTQSREDAPWYQHEELGYNYRMSNVVAGVVRGQIPYLYEHIAQKKAIYERYKEGLKDLPVSMNPFIEGTMEPNFWLSCLLIDKDAMCEQVRSDNKALYYKKNPNTTCPTEIYQQLMSHNAQCRPIWKPMHLQPMYRMNPFITVEGNGRSRTNAYIEENKAVDVGADIFERGLCLPSDNKMTPEEQDRIIEIIHRCF